MTRKGGRGQEDDRKESEGQRMEGSRRMTGEG